MQQPTSSSRPARLPLIFSGIAAFACICIVVIFRGPSSPSYTWVGDDFPHTLPISLPPKKHVMKADESHFGLQADHEWSAIFPKPWNGFLSLGPEKRTFAVSVYHQLHCLDLIRGALNDKINEEFTEFVGHAEHCLRYLKDTILCRADMTLEKSFWSEDRHGNTVPGADGVGATHECVDWDVLKTFMEENPVVLPPNATAKGGEVSGGHRHQHIGK